jgi:tRNA pseudouridine55 synthase
MKVMMCFTSHLKASCFCEGNLILPVNSLPRNGWIIIDKPLGLSSAQAVARLKYWLRPKKIGHGGTLDPLATGVLPIAIGEATKLSGYLLDADKGYDFTLTFGEQRDTDDGEGRVVATSDVRPTLEQIEAILPQFTGPISQMPPAYSALKVDGKRAYAVARAGGEVKLAMRQVVIHQISLCSPPLAPPLKGRGIVTCASLPFRGGARGRERQLLLNEAHFSVSCSKGTYIRSLARDIALALGSVGYVSALRRTKAGPFTLDQAIALPPRLETEQDGSNLLDSGAQDRHRHALDQAILPLTAGLDDIPAFTVTPDQATALRHGQRILGVSNHAGISVAVTDPCDGVSVPVAIVDITVEAGVSSARVVRGLNIID